MLKNILMNKFLLTTIGTKTEDIKSIKRIIKSSDVVRINGSHNIISWHEKISKRIRLINKNTVILFDIPGIKPRTANQDIINISLNEKIILYFKKTLEITNLNIKKIQLTKPLPLYQNKSKNFTISDGQYSFNIIKKNKNYLIGKSNSSFKLLPKKGLNIIGAEFSDKIQSKTYVDFLKTAEKVNYDAIGLSFVQSNKVIKEIKKIQPNAIIVSKIENSKGLKNLEEIINESDCIMIDRGDLSAEIGSENLFNAVIKITKETKKQGRPLIIATENLDSMMFKLTPSKSEIMSLGLNIFMGTDKIMLSEETALSNNWKNTLNWLDNYFKYSQTRQIDLGNYNNNFVENKLNKIWKATAAVKEYPFLVVTKSGKAIFQHQKINNKTTLYVFTDSPKVIKLCKFWSNTLSFYVNKIPSKNIDKYVMKICKEYKSILFKSNSTIASIFVMNPSKGSRANTLYFINKSDTHNN